jgi:hypothetical protein
MTDKWNQMKAETLVTLDLVKSCLVGLSTSDG